MALPPQMRRVPRPSIMHSLVSVGEAQPACSFPSPSLYVIKLGPEPEGNLLPLAPGQQTPFARQMWLLQVALSQSNRDIPLAVQGAFPQELPCFS